MYTPTTILGKRYVQKLAPWITEDLERYADSIGLMFQQVLELAEEEGSQGEPGWVPAWGKLVNPTLCPGKYLFFPAQMAGVELPKVVSEAEARELILGEAALQRGTTASIEAAIKRVLGAGVKFTVEERTNLKGEPDAYFFTVIVPPGKGSKALNEAIENVKPGGVLFGVVEIEGSWLAGTLKWNEVGAGVQWATVVEGEY